MKIEEVRREGKSRKAGSVGGGKAPSGAAKTEAAESASFTEQIGKFFRGGQREELDRLLAQIDKSQEKLLGNFTFDNLYAYKGSVAKFLRVALDQTYESTMTQGKSKSGKPKMLMTARMVNEKIQGIIDEVLKRQGPITSYLGRLNEIRGLLVDMYE